MNDRRAGRALVAFGAVLLLASACSSSAPGTGPAAGPAPGSDLTAAEARRARAAEATRSASCATCHPAIYAEHMENTHGLAFIDPEPRIATREFHREDCIRCHTPRPVYETGTGMTPMARLTNLEEGNTCISCHGKAGYDYAEFRGGKECRVAFDGNVGSVQACATCHRISGTPEQWMRAPAGGLAERKCIACHMPLVERPVAVGEPPRKVRSHVFPASRSESQLRRAYTYEARVDGNELVVRITNSGAGHNFNTGTIQRAIESVVRVRDASGKELTTDRKAFKNEYWSFDGLRLPTPSIPPGQTREHRVPLGITAGTVECELLFKHYYPMEDGHPDLVRRLEHRILDFAGVDPTAPPPPPTPAGPPPSFPAVTPAQAARVDALEKYAHPAAGVREATIPEGNAPADIERLVSLLEYPVPEARRRARRRLVAIGAPAAPELVRALGHWSNETFVQAMDILVAMGADAEPAVRAALGDGALYVRIHARQVLARMDFPAARDEVRTTLLASLSAPAPLDRRGAAEALGALGDPVAASPLRALLGDEDWDVVSAAAGALARLGDREAVPALERTFRLARFKETRLDLAAALAALGSPLGVPALLDGMDDDDEVVRQRFFDAFFAATGLHESYDPGVARMVRLESLARLRGAWAARGGAGALRPAPVPGDTYSRERAWSLVETLGGGTDVLPGGDDEAITEELAALGETAVPALIDGLTFPPGFTRKRALACQVLGRIGDVRAAPCLVRVLRDPDLVVAAWACWALGQVKDPAAIPALRRYEQRLVAYARTHPGSPEAAADTGPAAVVEVLAGLGDRWAIEEKDRLRPAAQPR